MAHVTRVGIHAPYGWDEVTQMAVGLAETITHFGFHVSYLPTQMAMTDPKTQSIHHRWDHVVTDTALFDYDEWLEMVDPVIWFDVHPDKVAKAKKMRRKNYLVPLWHTLTPEDVPSLELYDKVICPTRETYKMLRPLMPGRKTLQLVEWDSSLPLCDRRCRRAMPGEMRLFVHVDAPTVVACGDHIMRTIAELFAKDTKNEVHVAISHAADWTVPALMCQHVFEDDPRISPRFIDLPRCGFLERYDAYRVHDWVWVPSVRNSANVPILEALAMARPVIAFDCPPAGDLVVTNYNGVAIPVCGVQKTALGAPVPSPLWADVRKIVRDTVLKQDAMIEIHKHTWTELERRRRDYQDAWRGLLKKSSAAMDNVEV